MAARRRVRIADAAVSGSEPEAPSEALRWCRLSWQTRDRHRWITLLGLVGLVTAAVMAVYGLPPVDLHGPLHRLGIMDPLCGGTRSARFTAQGDLIQAWRYNPLGIVTVSIALAATARTAIGVLARRWLSLQMTWTPGRRRLTVVVLVVLLVALDVRQQLRADLLIAGT